MSPVCECVSVCVWQQFGGLKGLDCFCFAQHRLALCSKGFRVRGEDTGDAFKHRVCIRIIQEWKTLVLCCVCARAHAFASE